MNLQGILDKEDIRKIRKGFSIYQSAKVHMLETDITRDRCRFELTIFEGKNHEVKNMMAELGHQVRRLHRAAFGMIELGNLRPGEYRILKPYEVKQLRLLATQGENL